MGVPADCLSSQSQNNRRRLEDEDEEERALQSLGKFDDTCQRRLTKPNGSAKTNRRAVCTLCSKGWFDECNEYGSPKKVTDKNLLRVPSALKECIAEGDSVPADCLSSQSQNNRRRLEDEDEEERALQSLGKFDGKCQRRLTKPNGSAKTNRRLFVLCVQRGGSTNATNMEALK